MATTGQRPSVKKKPKSVEKKPKRASPVIPPKNIKVNGKCLDMHCMEDMRKANKDKTFEIYVRTPIDIKLRKFCFVTYGDNRLLVDYVTGSIYSTSTGYCTSTNQLRLVSPIALDYTH